MKNEGTISKNYLDIEMTFSHGQGKISGHPKQTGKNRASFVFNILSRWVIWPSRDFSDTQYILLKSMFTWKKFDLDTEFKVTIKVNVSVYIVTFLFTISIPSNALCTYAFLRL